MARYSNILETIGKTPVIRINRLAPAGVNLFVKSEAFNPLGSVKAAMYPACGVAVMRAALMESADRRPIKSTNSNGS